MPTHVPNGSANMPSTHFGQMLPSGLCVEMPTPELLGTYKERVSLGREGHVAECSASADDAHALRPFLASVGLEELAGVLEREQISVDILAEMGHEDLRAVGVAAYGHRHRLMRAARQHHAGKDSVAQLRDVTPKNSKSCGYGQNEYDVIEREIAMSTRTHRSRVNSHFNILKIQKVVNFVLWERYQQRRREVAAEAGNANEHMLLHGSPCIKNIVTEGFDERLACTTGIFGPGIYFAEQCAKSDTYVFGNPYCPAHKDMTCYICERQMLLCRVTLGRAAQFLRPRWHAHAPPRHHAVTAPAGRGVFCCGEHVIYRGEQAYPEYVITYRIVHDGDHAAAIQHYESYENLNDVSL